MAELVPLGATADNGPVVHVGLAGNPYETHEDAVVPHPAVVRNMHIGHNQHVVSDLRHALSAGLRPAVDGGAFADGHPVSDFHPGHFPFELEVLGNGADHGTGEHGAVGSDFYIRIDRRVIEDPGSGTDFHIVVNEGIRSYFNVFCKFGSRMNGCQGMNLSHYLKIYLSLLPPGYSFDAPVCMPPRVP